MTSLFDSIQSPGRKTVLAALVAGLCVAAPAFAVPGNVVISAVYAGGGNANAPYTRDFIELFNRSASTVSLKGMSVQYQSATGTAWAATALPDVSLAPGQYFLVAQATGGAVGADLGTADATGTLNMAVGAGKVALANTAGNLPAGEAFPSANIMDLVGWGSTATVYETARAPLTTNLTALYRASAGCNDTDNNATDFSAAAVTNPRRTTSALNACAGGTPVAAPIVLNCPASVAAPSGSAISAILRASDVDSIVNGATITSVSTASGISLSGFTPATAAGGSASVNLDIAANLPTGIYSVTVNFTNNNNQSNSCTIPVNVAGVLTIPQIQSANAKSPYAGTVQTTTGVITGKVAGGFFIQDQNGDGDPTTSDGLYIFTSNFTGNIGDKVTVTGMITEYTPAAATRSVTEMTAVTGLTVIGTGIAIAPTNIQLPADDLARYEGMLVRFTAPLTVNGTNYLGSRGELILSNGRREVPTNRFRAGTAEAIALQQANDKNWVLLDDGIFVTPTTVPYLGDDGTVRAGDTVSDLTGVLDFGSMGGGGAWFKLQPTVTPVISRTNVRTEAPVIAAGNVKVASANVLNFFTTFTNGGDAWGRTGQGCTIGNSAPTTGNCRGADNLAEFVRQRDKIVNELKAMDADAVGLMEIQNNGDIAATYLVEQLNIAIGSNAYAVVPKPPATGTDAIRVAMIYKPAKLTLVGGALSDGDVINNRPPIAATFKAANGGKFSLVVNHLKSKGSCPSSGAGNTDTGDGQGCWNVTRLSQAQRLMTYFIPQVVATSGDPDVIIVGDMNAYGHEDPIAYYTSNGMVNQLERFIRPRTQPYSYVFDGESGYLDHALTTTALSSQVVDAAEWHNNADEPTAIDYNIGDTTTDYYTNNAFRASDHDPVVVSLNLAGTSVDVTASVKVTRGALTVNRTNGKYIGAITVTNTSNAALAGPLNYRLDGLTNGVTLDNASGSVNGAPYLTLPNGLAAGASVTLTTTFTNPAKVAIGYTAALISGAF
ncbi:MAG: ExeM/NucH family extracellular endonuclease [Pseudomonadota bacterium]|nr:ExeM/NucH family extracellular endonuclease [Pseudomonadota bacterium]